VNFSSQNNQLGFYDSIKQLNDVLSNSALGIPTYCFLLLLLVAIFFILRGVWNGRSLTSKEFLEQSSRRRTYIMRTVYALLVMFGAWMLSYDLLRRVHSMGMDALGEGRNLFTSFTAIQFIGIYLFTPAMTCSLLTSEKERDTLSLLMLTRLDPWGMILGKLISRVIPMMLFAGLSMPLCAFAYSLGGVDQTMIAVAIYTMCLTILQCAALGVMCSAIFRTTVGAFIASYILGFLLLFGLPMLDEWLRFSQPLGRFLAKMFGDRPFLGFRNRDFPFMFMAPYFVIEYAWRTTHSFWYRVMQSLPIVVLIVTMLYVARFCVIRRAFAPPKNLLLGLFRWVDEIFVKANDRFAKGVLISSSDDRLPDDKPVAWRETNKKALGTTRYLVRILVGLEFPVAFVCAVAVADSSRPTDPLSFLLILVWVVSLLLLAVSGSCLVSGERSKQTIDVLLTTPLSNQQILRQKYTGVRRLMLVLWVPFLTIYIFQFWLKWSIPELTRHGYNIRSGHSHETIVFIYIISCLVTTFIYFHFIALVSMLIGLRVRSQAKAIFATLGTLVAWCVLPLAGVFLLERFAQTDRETIEYALLMSPASMIPMTEFQGYGRPLVALAINSLIYGSITLVLYWYLLIAPHGLLNRNDTRERRSLSGRRPSVPLRE
jgi:ABC-type transport system involved in multi-copper enzyme maturation permease subunit